MAMSRNDIIEKVMDVKKMAMPTSDFDVTTLSEDDDLVNDLGLSSVGVLYIVIAIEEFFNIRFDDVGFADFNTIGNVIDYIERKVQE